MRGSQGLLLEAFGVSGPFASLSFAARGELLVQNTSTRPGEGTLLLHLWPSSCKARAGMLGFVSWKNTSN